MIINEMKKKKRMVIFTTWNSYRTNGPVSFTEYRIGSKKYEIII